MSRAPAWAALLLPGLLVTGCGGTGEREVGPPLRSAPASSPSDSPGATTTPRADGTGTPQPRPDVRPRDFDPDRAEAVVGHLAGAIGPRHATSPAFREAVAWTVGSFERLGYRVRRQAFEVPGGVSWGVPVPAGESVNVVATPAGFDPAAPHLVVGAHLDTVPQAPGAEDNASGVGVLLAAAAAAAEGRTRLPVVWVALRGRGAPRPDRRRPPLRLPRVRRRDAARRAAVDAGDGLPRPGRGGRHRAGGVGRRLRPGAAVAARRRPAGRGAGVRRPVPAQQRPLVLRPGGAAGARLGSTSYAAYHSPADRPAVVDRAQLERTGRLLLAWLARTP